MNDLLDKLLLLSIQSAIKAGEKVMEIYESLDFEIEIKQDLSPITKADKISNQIILEYLEESKIPVLSEESKMIPYSERKNWNLLWIVDPIDGTKEFIKRNGDFTVNIALIENQIPILGVIYIPVTKELYFASKSIGSYKIKIDNFNINLNEIIRNAKKLPLKYQKKSFTFVASQTHNSKETNDFIDEISKNLESYEIVTRGSSLKLCLIAEGVANMYPRLSPTMEWDIAAGHAICLYAGFDVYCIKNSKTLKYNKENLLNNWFIAK
jgi:3'(2'), 5'-bisphosphate nucleotidase